VTALQVRRVRFDLDGDVPFVWNPANPAFAVQMNAVSIIAIAFEKFIVAAVREALPAITDAAVAAEADAFLRQEAQHASCHRHHVRALVRSYPGLQQTVDAAVARFDALTAGRSLAYRLAYIADLEATFTPMFKLFLDNEQALFGAGDERVGSLFLWHFVEEIEHRSSGLIVYHAVVGSRWYRVQQLPSVVFHLNRVLHLIIDGFNAHVPLADRQIDARLMLPSYGRRQLTQRVLRSRATSVAAPYSDVPRRDIVAAVRNLARTQTPGHDPADQPLPAFADRWFAQYANGADIAHWYSAAQVG
jgi:predicted metal-dependent hydrolase